MNYEIELFNKNYLEKFSCRKVVLGAGKCPAPIMLVGEAPGREEVKLGKPFVGPAGKNLSEFLYFLGLKREDIYITNTIKYRLSQINEKTGREINRPPKKSDIEENLFFLQKEVSIVKPDVIVTLGNVALKGITGDFSINIGQYHGRLIQWDINGIGYNIFPLYHPASVIYNRKLYSTYLEDLNELKMTLKSIIKELKDN